MLPETGHRLLLIAELAWVSLHHTSMYSVQVHAFSLSIPQSPFYKNRIVLLLKDVVSTDEKIGSYSTEEVYKSRQTER